MLVNEHCEALMDDLSRYHGKRLQDLFTSGMSWDELGAFIDRLPPESSYRTEIRDSFTDEELAELYEANVSEKHGPWSKHELLLTQVHWQLQQVVYVLLLANGAKNVAPPEPIPMPGTRRRAARVSEADVTWLDDVRERNKRAAEAG